MRLMHLQTHITKTASRQKLPACGFASSGNRLERRTSSRVWQRRSLKLVSAPCQDVEKGTMYNYFRDYDPATGRYVQSDPIGLAGGPSTYAYVLNDPMQLVDRDGKLPSLPQPFVDVVVGFGDGASIGLTRLYRDWRNIGSVDTCSASYAVGNLASLALGLTRVAYAGAVAASAASASSGVAASAARSALRRRFGGGDSFRPPNLARYADDAELRLAAGRTNPGANAWGAGAAGAGAAGSPATPRDSGSDAAVDKCCKISASL
jgi:RHS repeat-associated protein